MMNKVKQMLEANAGLLIHLAILYTAMVLTIRIAHGVWVWY